MLATWPAHCQPLRYRPSGGVRRLGASYSALTAVAPEVDQIILDAIGGSPVLNRNWFAGSDNWFFSNSPLMTLEDFKDVTIRSHGAAISDFIVGMGAEAEFLGAGQFYCLGTGPS